MYLAGVSVCRVEDITEALWSAKAGSSTASELNQKIYGKIEGWRKQPIPGEHPYVFVDGVYRKRSWCGEVQNVSVPVAVGGNDEGYREIPGVAEGGREDRESWSNFLRYLKERGRKDMSTCKLYEGGIRGKGGRLRLRNRPAPSELSGRSVASAAPAHVCHLQSLRNKCAQNIGHYPCLIPSPDSICLKWRMQLSKSPSSPTRIPSSESPCPDIGRGGDSFT